MMATVTPAQSYVAIIRSEYNEMPGMRLTLPQARRLWSLSLEECEELLERLVRAGFLVRDEHDRYGRRADRVTR